MRVGGRAEGSYLKLLEDHTLTERVFALKAMLQSCELCPRQCGVDRLAEEKGYCGIGSRAIVASYGKHFGEESVLVGNGGSGTVFLSGCNLGCKFCQNFTISCAREGVEVGPGELAEIMLRLQSQGSENINWVTPTHVVPQLLEGLIRAARNGLTLPIVFNCGGYESTHVLAALEGAVDIYMPDAKFASPAVSSRLASVSDYFERACEAIEVMHSQVGHLAIDDRGVAIRGVLVRHLVLPGEQAGSEAWASALRRIMGPGGAVNVMAQYRPEYEAASYPPLDRRVRTQEVVDAAALFAAKGLRLIR